MRGDRGRDDHDGDVVGGAEVADDAGVTRLSERVREVHRGERQDDLRKTRSVDIGRHSMPD